eukprot:TRINITY_DN5055_c0_g1_i13.p1 TRINITY_DN5055_c0_g1~~TRINITY_DN5055_c0_g1_i13.p1  ORF type:complete len:303 (+),score=35.67 TRINITY_DN5055_c0_g1_i13:73-981(+)
MCIRDRNIACGSIIQFKSYPTFNLNGGFVSTFFQLQLPQNAHSGHLHRHEDICRQESETAQRVPIAVTGRESVKERASVEEMNVFDVLEKVKCMIDCLNREAVQRSGSLQSDADSINEYEKMIQRLEEEARNHIRLEQQLKLHIESLQSTIEQLEHANGLLQKQIKEAAYPKKPVESSRHKHKKERGKSLDWNVVPESDMSRTHDKSRQTQMKNILKLINVNRIKKHNATSKINHSGDKMKISSNGLLSDEIATLKSELYTLRTELIKKKERKLSSGNVVRDSISDLNQIAIIKAEGTWPFT